MLISSETSPARVMNAASAASQIEAWRHYSIGMRDSQTPLCAVAELGCCAPSIELARARAALGASLLPRGEGQEERAKRRGPRGEGGLRGAQPWPRVLEPGASSVADSTAFHRAGMAAAAGDVILSGFASIYFERVLKSVEETYSVR